MMLTLKIEIKYKTPNTSFPITIVESKPLPNRKSEEKSRCFRTSPIILSSVAKHHKCREK